MIDDKSRTSDISPAVRFFVFTEKPDPDRLIRIGKIGDGHQLHQLDDRPRNSPAALADWLYIQMLQRKATDRERAAATRILTAGGSTIQASGLEDLLWALSMTPEFQYIH